jgi:hypothetical protein
MRHSVTCGTASGGSRSFGRLSQADQKVANRVQILDGSYNAGSHYGFNIKAPIPKQRRSIWAVMRKGQCRKATSDRNIETPDANSLWHVVRVYCLNLLGLIG